MLSKNPKIAVRFRFVLSHRDVDDFQFTEQDRIWVLSYSHKVEENNSLINKIMASNFYEVIYFSSATTNVAEITECYRYPYVKLQAEIMARRILDARIVTLGVIFEKPTDLPTGVSISTGLSQLANFMLNPIWPADRDKKVLLFKRETREFRSRLERITYQIYGKLITVLRWPCILRPIDLVLRSFGCRWYGYVYLSNRIWLTTTS